MFSSVLLTKERAAGFFFLRVREKVDLGFAAGASPGSLLGSKILGSHINLLNQNLHFHKILWGIHIHISIWEAKFKKVLKSGLAQTLDYVHYIRRGAAGRRHFLHPVCWPWACAFKLVLPLWVILWLTTSSSPFFFPLPVSKVSVMLCPYLSLEKFMAAPDV